MNEQLNFEKMNGLIPAVVQDAVDGTVLMSGFMNREALDRTRQEGVVWFYSRTKLRLWKKGETSGNILRVVSIDPDCDNDALLVRVVPAGPVCHTGERSCFPESLRTSGQVLRALSDTIADRKKMMPENSYTTALFREGIARIAQKVGEEAVELTISAQYPDKQRCIEESADLIYHLLVLLAAKEIDLSQVTAELSSRTKK
ncbi:MAG TPA: bifunctional phosphoribosyl-AMP cyclohydrolase/phosphoribosyl-ATP diphosphatase HisIE [Bacteroidota bacterium]|nr:bifunctional phosphoribosyl-AMP cyclohydrolase/phosphoribosyl-ATP diphosphatase HisIE [Bacteroidota bacterium]